MNQKELDNLCVSAIRATCIDVVNKAKSGHPGMALGSAPILYTLYTKHLIANPKDPEWFNRDRFVLSAGHASSLLYTMLHVSGYPLSIDDLKSFRQDSRCFQLYRALCLRYRLQYFCQSPKAYS